MVGIDVNEVQDPGCKSVSPLLRKVPQERHAIAKGAQPFLGRLENRSKVKIVYPVPKVIIRSVRIDVIQLFTLGEPAYLLREVTSESSNLYENPPQTEEIDRRQHVRLSLPGHHPLEIGYRGVWRRHDIMPAQPAFPGSPRLSRDFGPLPVSVATRFAQPWQESHGLPCFPRRSMSLSLQQIRFLRPTSSDCPLLCTHHLQKSSTTRISKNLEITVEKGVDLVERLSGHSVYVFIFGGF